MILALIASMVAAIPFDDYGPGHCRVSIDVGVREVRAGSPAPIAVIFDIEPGWHIYWRNPGDSGLETTVAWELPEGWRAGALQWPAPTKFIDAGVVNYGYKDAVTLFTVIEPAANAASGDHTIRARADWLACREGCVPGSQNLEFRIMVGDTNRVDRDFAERHRYFRDRIPTPLPNQVSVEMSEAAFVLVVEGLADAEDVYFFSADPNAAAHDKPQPARRDGGKLFLTIPRSGLQAKPPARLHGVLVVQNERQRRAYEIDIPLAGATGEEKRL